MDAPRVTRCLFVLVEHLTAAGSKAGYLSVLVPGGASVSSSLLRAEDWQDGMGAVGELFTKAFPNRPGRSPLAE